MNKVISKDGTLIAFDKTGQGPALILVGGALQQRAGDVETAKLVVLLKQNFTVYHYDRRGRGDSTDTLPFAVEHEIEDLEALINESGGSAYLFGMSSGGALAMEAAIKLGSKVKKLAMYEVPYFDDETLRRTWKEYRHNLNEALAAGRRGEAVGLFMMMVGLPADQLDETHRHPMWPMWEAAAPTLAYDAAATGEDASIPTSRAAKVTVPTLVMNGGASFPFMHITAVKLARAIPHAQHRVLEGQTHEVSAGALAPVLIEFFESA